MARASRSVVLRAASRHSAAAALKRSSPVLMTCSSHPAQRNLQPHQRFQVFGKNLIVNSIPAVAIPKKARSEGDGASSQTNAIGPGCALGAPNHTDGRSTTSSNKWGLRSIPGFDKWPHRGTVVQAPSFLRRRQHLRYHPRRSANAKTDPLAETIRAEGASREWSGPGQEQGSHLVRALPTLPSFIYWSEASPKRPGNRDRCSTARRSREDAFKTKSLGSAKELIANDDLSVAVP